MDLSECEVKGITEERTCFRKVPSHLDDPLARAFSKMTTGRIKARSVVTLEGAVHWGGAYGCVATTDGMVVRDYSPDFQDFETDGDPNWHSILDRPWLPDIEEIAGSALALNTFGHRNFHHWLLDSLTAFSILQDAGLEPRHWDQVILQGKAQGFQIQCLEKLGIPANKILPTHAGRRVRCDRLTIPSYSEPGRQPELYDYTPEGLAFARKIFLGSSSQAPIRASRLVISRRKASARRWVEGDAATEHLRSAGFQEVLLEEFTVAEQANLFAQAETIVMPTGGNLANMVFCRPGTRIVELFHPSYLPAFSLTLAPALGLDYVGLVEDSCVQTDSSDRGKWEDVRIPLDRVLDFATHRA